jgi:hypothetical protein
VKQAGLPRDESAAVLKAYSDSQIQALKNALLVASMFAFVGLWFARALPAEHLTAAGRT